MIRVLRLINRNLHKTLSLASLSISGRAGLIKSGEASISGATWLARRRRFVNILEETSAGKSEVEIPETARGRLVCFIYRRGR